MPWTQQNQPGGHPWDAVAYGTASQYATYRASGSLYVMASTNGGSTFAQAYTATTTMTTPVNASCSTTGTVAAVVIGTTAIRVTLNGTTWAPKSPGIGTVMAVAVSGDGTTIAAHSGTSVAVSYNQGTAWSTIATGLAASTAALALSGDGSLVAFTAAGAGGQMRVYNKATATTTTAGLTGTWVSVDMTPGGSAIIAGSKEAGLQRSTDRGATWTALPSPMTGYTSVTVSDSGQAIGVVVTNKVSDVVKPAGVESYAGRMVLSRDGGATWMLLAPSFGAATTKPAPASLTATAVSPDGLKAIAAAGMYLWNRDESVLPTQTWKNMLFGAKQVQVIYQGWDPIWRKP